MRDLDTVDDDLVIYGQPTPTWLPTSQVALHRNLSEGDLPPELDGMAYMLEVDLAKEVVDVWRDWHQGKEPTLDGKCAAVIY
jgi:hypothetical protein